MKASLYRKLNPREFVVLHYIMNVNDTFSTRELAEDILGSHPRTIRVVLKQLDEYNILERVRIDQYKTQYLINSEEDWQI